MPPTGRSPVPLQLLSVVEIVLYLLAVIIHGRQMEWTARLDFLWQCQVSRPSTSPVNITCQAQLSTSPVNITCQAQLSTSPVNITCQTQLSTSPVKPSHQHHISTPVARLTRPHHLSIFTITLICQPHPPTSPVNSGRCPPHMPPLPVTATVCCQSAAEGQNTCNWI